MKLTLKTLHNQVSEIDDRVETVSLHLDVHSKKFDSIEKMLDKHSKNFENIEKRLEEHSEKFDNIEKRLEEHSEKFDNIEERLASLPQEIIEGVIQGLSPFIAFAERTSADHESRISALETKTTAGL